MRKHGLAQRAGDFMEGKGFYIVLFLCVAAIGISGYFLFRSLSFPATPAEDGLTAAVDGPAAVVVPPSPTLEAVKPSVDPDPSPVPAETEGPEEAPEPSPSSVPTMEEAEPAKAAPALFVWPLNGAAVTAFSPNALVRDETMGDWRTHDGVDLSCELGTEVMATAEGTVDSVRADDMLGTVVTIKHGGGIVSVYANLAEAVSVTAGDEVIAGDVIGAVGATAVAESGLPPHLHFALYQNGEPLDPSEWMAQRFG